MEFKQVAAVLGLHPINPGDRERIALLEALPVSLARVVHDRPMAETHGKGDERQEKFVGFFTGVEAKLLKRRRSGLHFEQHGGSTRIELTIANVVHTGDADCSLEDLFLKRVGLRIALDRILLSFVDIAPSDLGVIDEDGVLRFRKALEAFEDWKASAEKPAIKKLEVKFTLPIFDAEMIRRMLKRAGSQPPAGQKDVRWDADELERFAHNRLDEALKLKGKMRGYEADDEPEKAHECRVLYEDLLYEADVVSKMILARREAPQTEVTTEEAFHKSQLRQAAEILDGLDEEDVEDVLRRSGHLPREKS